MTARNICTSQATLHVEVTVKAGGKIYDVATLARLLGSVIETGLDSEEDFFITEFDALTIGVVEEGKKRKA